jgi:hypothetical protein
MAGAIGLDHHQRGDRGGGDRLAGPIDNPAAKGQAGFGRGVRQQRHAQHRLSIGL